MPVFKDNLPKGKGLPSTELRPECLGVFPSTPLTQGDIDHWYWTRDTPYPPGTKPSK